MSEWVNGSGRNRSWRQQAPARQDEKSWRAGAPLQWDVAAYVRMLGRPSIVRGTDALDLPAGKTSALLYHLAYRRDWVERDALLGLLYPESDERRGRQSLRSLIAYVRRGDLADAIDVEPNRLRWRVASDVAAFLAALNEDRRGAAVERYKGPFLEGFTIPGTNAFQGWTESVRAELAWGWRGAAIALVSDLCSEGHYGEAARLLARVLEMDPLDESALRLRLAVLAQGGQRGAAVAAYREFAAMLADELEVEPEEATARLAETIRSDEDDIVRRVVREQLEQSRGDGPKGRTRRPVPRSVVPFIGRKSELARLRECFRDGACRLVSLVGPGGMGKTALALEFGRLLEREGERAVVFASLAAADDVEGAASLIGDAVGLTFFGHASPREQLLAALSHGSYVLIVDNAERVAGLPALLHDILEHGENVRVLATSRERLGLRAEWVLEVEGLSHGEGSEAEAARLFESAARRADASFQVEDHRAVVARICGLVGGMPLALELAAGWLPVLTPAEIVEHLEEGLGFLRSEANDRPARHRAIEDVLEETWRRLEPEEREGLAALATFPAGFSLQQAETIAGVGSDLLRSLRRRALLRRGLEGRFHQHPLVWRYSRERAAELDAWEGVRERHARYYAERMQGAGARAAHHPDAPPPVEKAELPNVLEAWSWMVDRHRRDLLHLALDGLAALALATRTTQSVAQAVGDALVAAVDDDALCGRLLRVQGELLLYSAEFEGAREPLQAGLRVAQRRGEPFEEGLALFALTLLEDFSGKRSSESRSISARNWRRCVEIFREEGNRYYEARAMVNMAVALDDPLQQETLFRSAIAAYRSCDGRYALGLALHNLAETIRSVRGAYEEASTLLEEAVAVERSIALSHRLPWWLTARAEVLLDGGGLNEAEHDLMEAARFLAALQSGWGAWEAEHVAFVRGRLLLDRGDAVRASEVFRRIAVGESGRADPHGYRLKALCWRVLAAWRAEQWHLGETLARKARQALRDPSWTRMSSELALAPDGALVGGVLVEAHVRRGDVDAASGVLAEWVAILRRAPLLPAALHLGLAGARLGALAAKEGTEEQFLAMVATHTASAAHTRAEARRRLGALGSPRLHGPIDGDTRTGAPRVEDVLMALEALI